MNTFNTTMNCTHVQSSFFLIQNTCHFNVIPREARRGARAKWVHNLVAREAHAQCVNRAWVLASCKVAAFIFTCIYPMVSAMTSYSSWRHGAFLFLGNIRLKAISNSINDQSIHEELSFHRLQNNVYYRWISSHFSCKQNSKHKNAELSILAGEDLTPKNPLERERRLEIQRRKQQSWTGDSSNKQRSRENITQWILNAKVLSEQMEAILDN